MTSSEPINIHEAKNHLSKLCELAASGQDVLLARYGQPWVRLTALEPVKRVIRYGLLAGDVVISPDFDFREIESNAENPSVEATESEGTSQATPEAATEDDEPKNDERVSEKSPIEETSDSELPAPGDP